MTANVLPVGLRDNLKLSTWVGFDAPGKVRVSTGKVEIGQGVLTALAQIAAEELDIALEQVAIRSGETRFTPNEGLTAGSYSIENSGSSLRLACAEVRQLFLARAAEKLSCPVAALTMDRGVIKRDGKPTGLDYWDLSKEVSLDRDATGEAATKRPAEYRIVGHHAPRFDLPAKVTGAGFIQDFTPQHVTHARVLHQPRKGAHFVRLDVARAIRGAPVEMLQENDFIAFISADEAAVVAVHARAVELAEWEGGEPIAPDMADPHLLLSRESKPTVLDFNPAPPADAPRLSARYSKPFLAHASIATSSALARWENDKLSVWSHSQGVEMFVVAASDALGIPREAITVMHLQGAGCYGHNGADDAAFEAVLVAMKRPGETIRVCWPRADELTAAPFGSGMVVEVEATLGPDKRPISWRTDIWSGVHSIRPSMGGAPFASEAAMKGEMFTNPPFELPLTRGGGATRCSVPGYDFPTEKVTAHIVANTPVRTSALRGLGTFANIVSIESFMDELALAAGEDPVAYRLSCTSDPRARRVIERAAQMANWKPDAPGGEGIGRGFAYARYKSDGTYLAMVAEVEVEERVRVRRLIAAVDPGLAISPDGVRNQIEGGMIQAVSWAILEATPFGDGKVAVESWDDYPILRFSDAPEITIDLIGSQNDRPLGVGEAATGPTGAAVCNAVAHALGLRIRDLPLTRERLAAALSA
jgi:CO/xanthine dehydrogenase Mo-binding subunit